MVYPEPDGKTQDLLPFVVELEDFPGSLRDGLAQQFLEPVSVLGVVPMVQLADGDADLWGALFSQIHQGGQSQGGIAVFRIARLRCLVALM